MFVQANGIRMHYAIDGAGEAPWVTFVTGIANDLSMWEGQTRALAGSFRVLRYDLRGQGRTESTPGAYSVELLGRDLVALWDALNISRTHLVGLGLGGSIALGVAIDNPSRLSSLAACCCRARMEPDFAVMWHKLFDAVRQGGIEAIAEQTAQRWFSEAFKAAHPQMLDRVRSMIRATSEDGYLGVVQAFLDLDLEDRIHRIRAPTLFMGGAEDRIGGPEPVMRRLAAKVPGARYVIVPGAAHIANLQNENGFNTSLQEFLNAQ
jgi:3-oxoadipate enol-lactonase